MSKCQQCNLTKATIHIRSQEADSEQLLCWSCYNEILAENLGVRLQDIPGSISIHDNQGELRQFKVEKRLHPSGIRMEAKESNVYGYKFEVDGELEADQHLLFEQLVKKVKRGLETSYIKEGRFPNGQYYQTMRGDVLAGRIESGENGSDIPILVIDGKTYSWDEVGKILMSNEGFQIRMEIFDMTDDEER